MSGNGNSQAVPTGAGKAGTPDTTSDEDFEEF
jgi:hypothetical protein